MVDERAQRSTLAIAAVIGYGPTKRIVLSDALIAESTSAEFAFVVARALGHYLLTDPLKLALMRTLAFIIAIALGATIADRVGFRRDDDALSRLPLVTALMGVAALVLLPAYNAYARGIEARTVVATRTGAPWRDLPPDYGDWKNTHRRFCRWRVHHRPAPLCQRSKGR